MVFAICIHVCNFRVDGFFEMVWALESLVCEALAFERLPASFDVVECKNAPNNDPTSYVE